MYKLYNQSSGGKKYTGNETEEDTDGRNVFESFQESELIMQYYLLGAWFTWTARFYFGFLEVNHYYPEIWKAASKSQTISH